MSTRVRTRQIPMLRSADLTTRRLALIEISAPQPGPLVWLTAGLHGDEVGGTVVVHELFARLAGGGLRQGSVAAFPLLNPFGFEAASRQIPLSSEDLNRSFPGNASGSFAERVAELVHTRITGDEPALVLDLHNDWIRSIPYALIDPRPVSEAGRAAHAAARRAALASGLAVVDEQEEGVSRAALRSTLSGSLLEHGVPALTLELGAALMVVEQDVRAGVEAVWAILADLGMVEPTASSPTLVETLPPGYAGRVLGYSHAPRASTSGIVRFHVVPGTAIEAGAPLASVSDVFGRTVETLRAEQPALVLGHADSALVVPGAAIFALAMRRSSKRASAPE